MSSPRRVVMFTTGLTEPGGAARRSYLLATVLVAQAGMCGLGIVVSDIVANRAVIGGNYPLLCGPRMP